MFSEKDIQQIKEHAVSMDTVEQQIRQFKAGVSFVQLADSCRVDNGILKLADDAKEQLVTQYEASSATLNVVKFTPASGAATRMFKDLFAALDGHENEASKEFLNNAARFAFANELPEQIKGPELLDFVLNSEGLSYGSLPKALIKFHQKEGKGIASIEEHFVEGANYAKTNNGKVHLHFTVSVEHLAMVTNYCNTIKPHYEEQFGVKYQLDFSVQKTSTDTIAVNIDNTPFRESDGTLLFRPAGHGALLENLNDLEADIVFVKNIDNVQPQSRNQDTLYYKKVAGGLLLDIQNQLFNYLTLLEGNVDLELLQEMSSFAKNKLCIEVEPSPVQLREIFNRPIRVCGMVKNEGEPGGGPFFVKDESGCESLQIIESAQVDMNNETQCEILRSATHFNPVDLVCGIKNYKGKKFNLLDYRDLNTGFITEKSKDGKSLKALELPGLWNGAMANWNTVFLEVPLTTFSPVKTINDLLKEEHQG